MFKHSTNQLTTSMEETLRRELEQLNEDYTRALNWHDLVVRVLRNRNISPIYTCLYLSLMDTYPQLLDGKPADIQVWRVRENAGWVPERSTTNFFQDMNAINAFVYDAGKFDKKFENRTGRVTPIPNVSDAPESFDLKATERRRKAKEAEAKRRSQFKNPLQIYQCEECGSNNIVWDAYAKCLDCHHEHAPIRDILPGAITIDAEIEIADDFFASGDEPTAPRLVAVSAPVQQLPMTPLPSPRLGRHRDGWICDRCGQADKFVSVPTTWGGTIDVCTCSQE